MGNYASCALAGGAGRTDGGGGVKVVLPGGEICSFYEPVKAAELMLDNPNFFVVNSKSLQIGRRFAALNADEDLEMGELYVLVQMQRLGSVVRASDMGALFMATKKKASGTGKVTASPGTREAAEPVRLHVAGMEELGSPELMHRRSMCRSRRPVLETIVEEPITSR